MQDQERTDVFENDIEMWLDDYCQKKGIENLLDVPPNVWTGALGHVGKNLFKGTNLLRTSEKVDNGSALKSTCWAYDIDKVMEVLEIYVQLCYENNKQITQNGFCKLTGINLDTLNDWANRQNKLSSRGFDVVKIIKDEREESLVGLLTGGKLNPISVISILNHSYGWNLPGVSKEPAKIQSRSPEEIAALYGAKLSDNRSLEALPDMPE